MVVVSTPYEAGWGFQLHHVKNDETERFERGFNPLRSGVGFPT